MSVTCTWCDLPKDVQSLIMIYRGWACLGSAQSLHEAGVMFRPADVLNLHGGIPLANWAWVDRAFTTHFFWINRAHPDTNQFACIVAEEAAPAKRQRK